MLYVESDGTIQLTRGDTARLTITVSNVNEDQPYSLANDDTLTLSIKKRITDTEPCVQKTILGTNIFCIDHDDTKDLQFGKYIYDVQLTTGSGEVYTIITPSTFTVLQEVTC